MEIRELESDKPGVRKFKLCKDCDKCPIVEISDSGAVIRDDFGGKVTLDKEQFEALKKL